MSILSIDILISNGVTFPHWNEYVFVVYSLSSLYSLLPYNKCSFSNDAVRVLDAIPFFGELFVKTTIVLEEFITSSSSRLNFSSSHKSNSVFLTCFLETKR